jgi:tripartite-type tricarboxylate transporter receptor subunit TctC
MPDRARCGAFALLLLAALVPALPSLAAEEEMFHGKTITIIVGYPPGGGYDAYARLFAAHLGRLMPGHPGVIIQNMPGASSINAANYVYEKAPRDGTALLVLASSAAFAPVFGNKAARYRPDGFSWIGNFDQATGTCSVWQTSGITSFKDLLSRQSLFGASGPAGVDSEYARAMNVLFGTRIKLIHGYDGAPDVALAMKRGEVEGGCGYMKSSLDSVYRDDYLQHRLVPIVQFARKDPSLAGVPHVQDFAASEAEKQLYDLIFSRDVLGRPLAAPPGVTPDRLAVLRAGFDAVMADQEFRAAAAHANLPLTPMSGVAAEAFVTRMMAASPESVARARQALALGVGENEQLQSLEGTIAGIGGDMLELRDGGGGSHRLRLSQGASKIMLAGQPAEPAALKTGMRCSLRYYNEGDLAQTIACQ